MKYLVTGGAGFIGSNYLQYVVNKYPEDEFICLDALTYAGNYNNINLHTLYGKQIQTFDKPEVFHNRRRYYRQAMSPASNYTPPIIPQ